MIGRSGTTALKVSRSFNGGSTYDSIQVWAGVVGQTWNGTAILPTLSNRGDT